VSAHSGATAAVAGRVVGSSPLRVFGLPSEERLRRQLARAGAVATAETATRIVLLRADWVFDDALVRGLAKSGEDVALIADGCECIALCAPVSRADEAAGALLERRATPGLRVVSATDIADGYNKTLLKREAPYLMPLDAAGLPAIEQRVFSAVYKGVTDLVTLYFWPAPALVATRFCARVGIRPNQVTCASLLLVLAAMYQFWHGHYLSGLVAAWLMTFLDTVDGKLARVSLLSTKFGNFFDHSIDLVHPPFWWWAWIVGLPAIGLPLADASLVLTVIIAGYVVQRLEEGLFGVIFGVGMHVWQPFDSRFRLITARRNPNLLLLSVAVLFGRPDLGIIAVAAWTVLSLLVHTVRMIQAAILRFRGPLRSWLAP
jgi:phosphatidylglycerophosphate synthase